MILTVSYRLERKPVVMVHFLGDGRFEEFRGKDPQGAETVAGRRGKVAKEKLGELMRTIVKAELFPAIDEQPDFSAFEWLGDDGERHRKSYTIPNKELLDAVEVLVAGNARI